MTPTPPTKQPAIDIDAVPVGVKLDVLIGERVMRLEPQGVQRGAVGRWRVPYGKSDAIFVFIMPPYSIDANRVREVETEMERRGLTYQYAAWLARELDIEVFGFTEKNFNHAAILAEQAYKLITATPEQRCRAAYRAVMG